jgi:hypothetical protein
LFLGQVTLAIGAAQFLFGFIPFRRRRHKRIETLPPSFSSAAPSFPAVDLSLDCNFPRTTRVLVWTSGLAMRGVFGSPFRRPPEFLCHGRRTMGKTICPGCTGHRIRRSPRRGFFEETLLRLVRMRPYRCHECGRRFFALTQPKSEGGGEPPPSGSEVSVTPQTATAEISSESNPHESVNSQA